MNKPGCSWGSKGHMTTAITNCGCFKLFFCSQGHSQVLFYSVCDVQHFPEIHDVTNDVLSDPQTEKHQLSYLHRLSYCTLVYLLKPENTMLFFSPLGFCVVFDCEIISLWFRSWSEERSVFVNSEPIRCGCHIYTSPVFQADRRLGLQVDLQTLRHTLLCVLCGFLGEWTRNFRFNPGKVWLNRPVHDWSLLAANYLLHCCLFITFFPF